MPEVITPFEQAFLKRLNKAAVLFFCLHAPVLMAVAWAADTGPLLALGLSLVVAAGPAIAYLTIQNLRFQSVICGITAMILGGLLVHFGQGPLQIEMHFYFFALLAMLSVFANPMVNLAAAFAVVLHHVIVWWLLPKSVFNYDAHWWVVLVHAAFVILETVAACYISRQFFDNVIGLEKIVEARTATIYENQRDMQLILDNVEEGLVTINLDGQMSSETSRVVKQWFGEPTGDNFAIWMAQTDADFGEWLNLALEMLKEGNLPCEVTLGQFPARLKDGQRSYSVHYQLIAKTDRRPSRISAEHPRITGAGSLGGEITSAEKLLVIITDITDQLSRSAAERYQSELLQLFQYMMRDKAGFMEFLMEADGIVETLKNKTYEGLDHFKRILHTLKGNSATFGMRHISELCHQVEDAIAEQPSLPLGVDMTVLTEAWDQIRQDIEGLIGGSRQNIKIDDADYEMVLKCLHDGADIRAVSQMLESWRFEPARKRLERVEQQIRGIAERMGKSNISVTIEPDDLRLDSEYFAPFWSAFIHVLRNTIDHGVEDREERLKAGKPGQSLIRVTTAVEGDRFVVAVEDDGPGVDWKQLRRKAGELGASAFEDSLQLICLPGLSSKDTITELSGRGMGMSVVVDACRSLGGTVELKSQRGIGTRLTFFFPKDHGVYEGHASILQQAAVVASTSTESREPKVTHV